MNVSRRDTGVDHSSTQVDNSSRVNQTHDDHSITTNTVTDNSTHHTSITTDNSDRRYFGQNTFLALVSALAIVAVVAIMGMREMRGTSSAPAIPAAVKIPAVETPATGTAAPVPDGMVLVPPNQGLPGQATISAPFALDRREVPADAFAAFTIAHPQFRRDQIPAAAHDGDYLKDWRDSASPPERTGRAIAYVTWAAADAFCRAQGYRLPTEQEWDYAARVGPAELAAMAGGMWEWTASEAPAGQQVRYVVRGGGWQDPPGGGGIAARQFLAPTITAPDLGFRCAR